MTKFEDYAELIRLYDLKQEAIAEYEKQVKLLRESYMPTQTTKVVIGARLISWDSAEDAEVSPYFEDVEVPEAASAGVGTAATVDPHNYIRLDPPA